MALRVTVTSHSDPEGEAIVSAAPLVGVSGLTDCRVSRVYHLDAVDGLARNDVDRLCREVLVDPVVAEYSIDDVPAAVGRAIEVAALPGVTDIEARELERAAQQLQIADLRVSTAVRYDLIGDLDDKSGSSHNQTATSQRHDRTVPCEGTLTGHVRRSSRR